jgi:hypothetical protein
MASRPAGVLSVLAPMRRTITACQASVLTARITLVIATGVIVSKEEPGSPPRIQSTS